MSDEKWEPCPRCGSNRIDSRGGCFYFILGFSCVGIFIWVTLLLPIIGIPGIILGAVFMFLAPFMSGTLQCEDCKKSWKYPADENEYIENSARAEPKINQNDS